MLITIFFLSVTQGTMAESGSVNNTWTCEVISGKQPEIILGGQSYLQVAVCIADGRKICHWKCKSSAVTGCKAVVKTMITKTTVINTALDKTMITNEEHVEIPDSANGIIKIHNHPYSMIMDMFKVAEHPSGNVYLPPSLWR